MLRLVSVWIMSALATTSTWAQQPNILWVTCEDISPTLSMYGDSTAQTPNLDRLATESMIFNEAFATVGVCAPARSSIITGMYPIAIGTQNMRTGHDMAGWGSRDYSSPSNAVDINGDSIPLYSAVIPAEVKCFTEYLRTAGYFCTNNAKTDYQFAAPVTAWDENSNQAHWKHRKEGQPFFSVFNINVSHESFLWKNKDKPLTADPAAVSLPPYFPDTETIRNDVARNYSNIELMDAEVGEKLKELEDAGLLDNTIIFFFSDHGGPLPRGKRLHYESGLRVPMMVRIPDRLQQTYNNDMISFVDLAPTVLALAGVEAPAYLQGEDFLGNDAVSPRPYVFGSGDRFDEFSDRVRTVISKDYVYVRNYHPELPAYKDNSYRKKIPMMNELLAMSESDQLNSDQNYWFRKTKTDEEFYLRRADPSSLNNLIDDPSYTAEIQALSLAMDTWLAEVNDQGAIPEKEMFLNMWPEGKQPQTAQPIAKVKKSVATLKAVGEGVSLAYTISDESIAPDLDAGWQLYTTPVPLKKGQYLYALANRIGYKDSEILIVNN
ncbi:sulfatase [Reichenbachiella carrageenanivorans]|uniref:Sulfatase n=1 Tax=Reichenbachiella carrageenanivorans TaxID=2979869 RepID=A0ABY6D0Z5_9BACT|nr:sulfatase [Reichenbachiella carrageenanivorans]UXX79826.1 sulfatase [Reichenbachiella carrageenanivorans]